MMNIRVGDVCIYKNRNGKALKVRVCDFEGKLGGDDVVRVAILENKGGWDAQETRVIDHAINSGRLMGFLLKYLTPIKISLENK